MEEMVSRWPPLTRSLDDPRSPVRVAVDQLLSDAKGVADVQRQYRKQAGPILVHSSGANPGTIGTAADLLFRFMLSDRPDMRLPIIGAARLSDGPRAAAIRLVADTGAQIPKSPGNVASAPPTDYTRDLSSHTRACWVLALFVEVARWGLVPGSPLFALAEADESDHSAYLALTSDDTAAELMALARVAREALLPRLLSRPAPWFVGPTFVASRMMRADADLIAGDALLEVKTNLGAKQKSGERRAALPLETLRQLLGYVLHDLDDEFRLSDVAVYDARYGYYAEWSLDELLHCVAGRRVELSVEREQYARVLKAGP